MNSAITNTTSHLAHHLFPGQLLHHFGIDFPLHIEPAPPIHALFLGLCACALSALVLTWRIAGAPGKYHPIPEYPPGPKGLPLLGNALDLPSTHQWLAFSKWGEQYGPVVHFSALGTHNIVLNTAAAASSILSGQSDRGGRFSDRPTFMMAARLVEMERLPALINYESGGEVEGIQAAYGTLYG